MLIIEAQIYAILNKNFIFLKKNKKRNNLFKDV